MSSEVKVYTKDGLESLDISQETAQKNILSILEDDGWVILKGVTDINSTEAARLHKHVLAVLSMARSGKFESRSKHWTYPNLVNAPFLRSDNWQDLAREKELIALACYHLGGGWDTQWHWEYDKGLRGNVLKETGFIEAHGQDIIMYNGWLSQRFPKPNKAMDMIMVKHRWSGFDWGRGSR